MRTFPAARAGALILLLAVTGWVQAAPAGTPTEALDAFHLALHKGDANKALDLLAKECTVYEQGFADFTRDEWANHQLKDAMAFAGKTEYRTLRRESRQAGDAAWVLSTTLTSGEFDGRKLELEGTETAILEQEGDAWKIVHLHWSAHEKALDNNADQPAAAPGRPGNDVPAPPPSKK